MFEKFKVIITLLAIILLPAFIPQNATGQSWSANLKKNQQQFVDLRFGMFIHFNIPTYQDEDWADPEASPALFNPAKLDCDQWAKAAKSANMSYGCLTAKHHSGFCIWDTKTTDYDVMSSPVKRDVVKEFVTAFRNNGLRVMLYYSILDTHHKLRPGNINKSHIELVKEQLTELFTQYGPVDALFIDGWDAPWARISYDEIPFQDIYLLVKSLQPDCLLMDLNAGKYPADALFYSDIKSYEQGAGQHIARDANRFPAMSCLPLQSRWFWKTNFPTTPVKDPVEMIENNVKPLNKAYCNFILNVAPNRDGLMDDNALEALKKIGSIWKNDGQVAQLSEETGAPVISPNIAKFKAVNSSWSNDADIMDLANDDNFYTAWKSNISVKQPWIEVDLERLQPFNMITLVETNTYISDYQIEYYTLGQWKRIPLEQSKKRVKIHRFDQVWGSKVRILISKFTSPPEIMEIGIYLEPAGLPVQTDNSLREGDKADPAINPIYNYYEWKNDIPENCPFERSKDIEGVIFSGRYANYTGADTWYLQSAPDGNMYSAWTDGKVDGFSTNSNIRSQSTGQAKIMGTDPLNLKFENLGRMWSGGANYYPCVSLIVDGTFYIGTYNAYNDEGYFNGFRYSTNWDHFTENTEPGWNNPYWTHAIDLDGNFFNEQGKAKFRTPHAVNFDRNNKAPDGMIYLTAHGYSSGKGRNDWDKGDAIYLCRAKANSADIINSKAYEFFSGHTNAGKAVWKAGVENAKPILDWPNHLGSESITWFPALKKYILMSCRLKEAEENLPYNVTSFWESDEITGPYKIVHYMQNWGEQTYFPNIPAQMINADGRSAWMTVACNYSVQNINPHQCRYAASMHEIIFKLNGKDLPEIPLEQKNIAPEAKVTASSYEPPVSLPQNAVNGIVDVDGKSLKNEWISEEGGGAILKLEWDTPKTINRIRIYDSPAADRWLQQGYFVFSDGSMEWMYAAPSNSAKTPAEINFKPKTVKWVKFTILKGIADKCKTTTCEPGQRLGVAEIQVFEVD